MNNIFDNKNILFIYSCLQSKIQLQQNIVFIKKVIDNILRENEGVNITILTQTDTLSLLTLDSVNVIRTNITKINILKIIKKENINVVFPICGDKKFNGVVGEVIENLKNKKILFLQKEYFTKNRSKSYFQNLALKAGFSIYRKKEIQNRQHCKEYSVVAIKDAFGNQILWNIIDKALVDEKKFLCSPSTLWKRDDCNVIMQILRNFGDLLKIKNVPYVIHFNIYYDGKIYFDNIEYGLTEEAIFSIQAQQIDMVDYFFKILDKVPITCSLNKTFIAYAYNFQNTGNISYTCDWENIQPLFSQQGIKTNSNNSLIYRIFLQSQKHNSYFKKINVNDLDLYFCSNSIKSSVSEEPISAINDKYIVVILTHSVYNDINDFICFLLTCERLKNKTNNHLILITPVCYPLINLVQWSSIFILDDIFSSNRLSFVFRKFNVKNVLYFDENINDQLMKCFKENDIKLYGRNEKDRILTNDNVDIREVFFKNLGYNYSIFSSRENIYDLFCIKDNHNNLYYKIITKDVFSKETNSLVTFSPPEYENLDVEKQILDATDKILYNISSYGLIHITFVYEDGDIIVNNIAGALPSKLLSINKIQKKIIFDIFIKSLLGENIDVDMRKNVIQKYKMFDQKIIFYLGDKQSIALKDVIKDKIFSKFKTFTLYK